MLAGGIVVSAALGVSVLALSLPPVPALEPSRAAARSPGSPGTDARSALPPAWIAAPDRPARSAARGQRLSHTTATAQGAERMRVPARRVPSRASNADRAAPAPDWPAPGEVKRRMDVLGLATKPKGLERIAALLDQPESDLTAGACTACWMATRDGVEDAALRRRFTRRLQELAAGAVELPTRRAATLALGRLDGGALERLPEGDPDTAAAVANALPPLCATGAERPLAHAERLARYGAGDGARTVAVRALACAGDAAAEQLTELSRGAEHDPASRQARLELARRAAGD